MSNAQLQLQFPTPGQWDKFTMTAVHEDADGYTRMDHYTQDTIPADQAPALAAVVAAMVSMDAPWSASQAWARQDRYYLNPINEDDPIVGVDAVYLDVEAVNDQGGRRIFTDRDYPDFVITDPAAVEFFRYFTNSTLNS